eukprot:113462-Pleurochrysis_carterae.AAC.1
MLLRTAANLARKSSCCVCSRPWMTSAPKAACVALMKCMAVAAAAERRMNTNDHVVRVVPPTTPNGTNGNALDATKASELGQRAKKQMRIGVLGCRSQPLWLRLGLDASLRASLVSRPHT